MSLSGRFLSFFVFGLFLAGSVFAEDIPISEDQSFRTRVAEMEVINAPDGDSIVVAAKEVAAAILLSYCDDCKYELTNQELEKWGIVGSFTANPRSVYHSRERRRMTTRDTNWLRFDPEKSSIEVLSAEEAVARQRDIVDKFQELSYLKGEIALVAFLNFFVTDAADQSYYVVGYLFEDTAGNLQYISKLTMNWNPGQGIAFQPAVLHPEERLALERDLNFPVTMPDEVLPTDEQNQLKAAQGTGTRGKWFIWGGGLALILAGGVAFARSRK